MFRINWNKDKVGFLNTWVLLAIFIIAMATIAVLIGLAIYQNDWESYSTPLKGVIIAWWVLSVVAVLVRVAIYRIGMVRKRERMKLEEQNKAEIKS